ncbi:MAG: hypothetical protein VKM17_02680 [Cyanobacteriota bacterium]|nr:hypothetical protein [Cyanobacteriota bacterium]
MLNTSTRITRRRSSAGPTPPQRPQQQPRLKPRDPSTRQTGQTGGQRPTFLTLRDHGKVYVADLPRLSDGQLTQIFKEAQSVLDSLNRRLGELDAQVFLNQADQDTRIRATTKRDVTERFLNAIAQEQELRRSNPALRAAAGESLARAFLELARHRLPGSTFDSLLQEALTACDPTEQGLAGSSDEVEMLRRFQGPESESEPEEVATTSLPVVISAEI